MLFCFGLSPSPDRPLSLKHYLPSLSSPRKEKCFSGGNYTVRRLWTFHPITVSGQTTVIYKTEIGEEMGSF